MNNKFKVGDKIVCIKSDDSSGLKKDKIYKVLGFSDNKQCVHVRDERGRNFGYYCWRFKLVKDSSNIQQYGIVKFCKENYK